MLTKLHVKFFKALYFIIFLTFEAGLNLGARHSSCSLPMAGADFSSSALLSAAPVSADCVQPWSGWMGPVHTSESGCLINTAG